MRFRHSINRAKTLRIDHCRSRAIESARHSSVALATPQASPRCPRISRQQYPFSPADDATVGPCDVRPVKRALRRAMAAYDTLDQFPPIRSRHHAPEQPGERRAMLDLVLKLFGDGEPLDQKTGGRRRGNTTEATSHRVTSYKYNFHNSCTWIIYPADLFIMTLIRP